MPPMRLSAVGRRFAAGGAIDPAEGDTDALTGRYVPTLDDTPRPPSFPLALPQPADEAECDRLRTNLRRAILDLRNDEIRARALREAAMRATAERQAAAQALAESEQMLHAVQRHSRAHLVEAYVNGAATEAIRSEADASLEVEHRRDQLQHAQEIVNALNTEVGSIEQGLDPRRRSITLAAGAVFSRAPETIALAERIYSAYRILRDARLAFAEVRRVVPLDSALTDRIDADQHHDDSRRSGLYSYDESLIADWQRAAFGLLRDADTVLPGDGNERANRGGENTTSIRSGPAAPQRDAHGKFLSSSNPVRRRGSAASRRRRRTGGALHLPERPPARSRQTAQPVTPQQRDEEEFPEKTRDISPQPTRVQRPSGAAPGTEKAARIYAPPK